MYQLDDLGNSKSCFYYLNEVVPEAGKAQTMRRSRALVRPAVRDPVAIATAALLD
jgi:hypothetical protein